MFSPDRFLLAGVMGWPVMHSRSPTLHNYLFGRYGLSGTYVPLAIEPAGLEAALLALGEAAAPLTPRRRRRSEEAELRCRRVWLDKCGHMWVRAECDQKSLGTNGLPVPSTGTGITLI